MKINLIGKDEVRAVLRADVAKNGLEIAGLPKREISDVIAGKRAPSRAILAHLGLRRVIMYEFLPSGGQECRSRPDRR